MLYLYEHPPDTVKEDSANVDAQAHDFLILVCTTPGSGALFRQFGWYPPAPRAEIDRIMADPVADGSDEIDIAEDSLELSVMFQEGVPIRNHSLANFIQTLRPSTSMAHSDLLLKIFRAAPELVADYFFRRRSFSFEPKPTDTWIGYAAFIFSALQLPVPAFFGRREGYDKQPPPVSIVIENILPQVLSQKALTRCLHQQSELIISFALRLLIASFQKLETVLGMFRTATAQGLDLYKLSSARLVAEFSRRCPRMRDVVLAFRATPESQSSQREAATRLLSLYYKIMPRIALEEKFDVSVPLATALGHQPPTDEAPETLRLRLLELGHLLRIARATPDMRWWQKPGKIYG
jgi:nucleolar pre-ribosomal-associated protein 1